MLKKVIVATYCEKTSIGSILQAVGLKRTLLQNGYESVIAQESEHKNTIMTKRTDFKHIVLRIIKCISRKKVLEKQKNCEQFIRENIDFCQVGDNLNDLFSHEEVFLAGSDQIWHPVIPSGLFWGEGVPEKTKRISYAASMGILEIQEVNKPRIKQSIELFDSISVREKECVQVLQPFTKKSIHTHIDPSFFLSPNDWQNYETPYPIEDAYILVYPLYWDPKYNQKLKQLYIATKKKIVVLGDYYRNIYANKWVFDADVSQFLWLIHHADAVITSSFHGAALSLNYNKKVAAVINPSAPSRITNLMECLGYRNPDILELAENENYDFTNVNARIKEETEKGITYLREALQK